MPLISPDYAALIKYLTDCNIAYELNAEIKRFYWLKMGEGKARIAIIPDSKSQLIDVVLKLQSNNAEFLVIGNGSNCYFTNDANIPILIVTTKLREVRFENDCIYADAGMALAALARDCSSKGYEGFEGLVGVPGTVGAAARNNSGSFFDCEMSKIVQSVEIIDRNGTVRTIRNEELAYTHRSSIIKRGVLDAVILAVNFIPIKGKSQLTIRHRVELAMQRRVSELEVRTKNLGAIFVSKEIWSALQNSNAWRVKFYLFAYRIAYKFAKITRFKLRFPTTEIFFLLFLRPGMIKHVSPKAINCYVWKGIRLNDEMFFSYIRFIRRIIDVRLEIEVFDKTSRALDADLISKNLDRQ